MTQFVLILCTREKSKSEGLTMKKKWVNVTGVVFLAGLCLFLGGNQAEAKAKKYTITTKSKPVDKKTRKKKT